ncbi:L-2-amino-thiazoline-4-carboxylic acid hydrolase [Ruminococcaceae bacterium YRB3002]|nr:L-2-amino-thiazoline-4-carboxylic acid hydrolase [Ruminococcaceae bacterium YRB3002]
MKYSGLPSAMWMMFKGSFEKHLISDLMFTQEEAKQIRKNAKSKYKEIIGKLPEFEKGDRFVTNEVNCALLIAFLCNMPRRPGVDEVTVFYENAMKTGITKAMCRKSGKAKFSDKDIASMINTANLRAADRNPYSWNMDYIPYEDGSGYEARFYKCGICTLMKEYGFFDLVPAMCHLDYTMSELGGASVFIRKYTLASGGPYCDCGYKKKC